MWMRGRKVIILIRVITCTHRAVVCRCVLSLIWVGRLVKVAVFVEFVVKIDLDIFRSVAETVAIIIVLIVVDKIARNTTTEAITHLLRFDINFLTILYLTLHLSLR